MILLTLKELKLTLKNETGLLFCFGTSLISRLIRAKTRINKDEQVPSHVAIVINGEFIYESTSNPARLGSKTIPSGVRRYLLKDFYQLERNKGTLYVFYPCDIDLCKAEKYIHYPYGKDTIVDFLLKDGSQGDSRGLICSQYGNICSEKMEEPCPSPATLFRFCLSDILEEANTDDLL